MFKTLYRTGPYKDTFSHYSSIEHSKSSEEISVQYWVTEDGDRIVTEDGDYIIWRKA